MRKNLIESLLAQTEGRVDEAEKAFHQYVVGRSRQILESLRAGDDLASIDADTLEENKQSDDTFFVGDVVDHDHLGKLEVVAIVDRDIYGKGAEFIVTDTKGKKRRISYDYLVGAIDKEFDEIDPSNLTESDQSDDVFGRDRILSKIKPIISKMNDIGSEEEYFEFIEARGEHKDVFDEYFTSPDALYVADRLHYHQKLDKKVGAFLRDLFDGLIESAGSTEKPTDDIDYIDEAPDGSPMLFPENGQYGFRKEEDGVLYVTSGYLIWKYIIDDLPFASEFTQQTIIDIMDNNKPVEEKRHDPIIEGRLSKEELGTMYVEGEEDELTEGKLELSQDDDGKLEITHVAGNEEDPRDVLSQDFAVVAEGLASKIMEAYMNELETIKVDLTTDGRETGGGKIKQNKVSPVNADGGAKKGAKPVKVTSDQHEGHDREKGPKYELGKPATNTVKRGFDAFSRVRGKPKGSILAQTQEETKADKTSPLTNPVKK